MNGAGVLLIVLAVALFAAEVKVASYGLLTVGGLAAMILGAMMLVDAPVPELRVPLRLLLPAALVMAAGTILLVRLVVAGAAPPARDGRGGPDRPRGGGGHRPPAGGLGAACWASAGAAWPTAEVASGEP